MENGGDPKLVKNGNEFNAKTDGILVIVSRQILANYTLNKF
jgi:hypothetical protein